MSATWPATGTVLHVQCLCQWSSEFTTYRRSAFASSLCSILLIKGQKRKGSPVVGMDRIGRCWCSVFRQSARAGRYSCRQLRSWRRLAGLTSLRQARRYPPSQPQGVTDVRPVAVYTAWWTEANTQMCVNNLPKVTAWKRSGRGSNLRPISRNYNHCTTVPRFTDNLLIIFGRFRFIDNCHATGNTYYLMYFAKCWPILIRDAIYEMLF